MADNGEATTQPVSPEVQAPASVVDEADEAAPSKDKGPRDQPGTCLSFSLPIGDESGVLDAILALGLQDIRRPEKPGASLPLYISNWEKITQDPWVLQVVKGYQIEWLSQPAQNRPPFMPRFSQKQKELMDAEIVKMVEKGAVVQTEETRDQFESHLFLTPKKDGSLRPVFNLKNLNKFVRYEHFKMEGIPAVVDMLQPGDWMIKIDLKDAYFSVIITEKDQKYLKFRWGNKWFKFRVLPFGLGSAPKVFTKLLKAALAVLRKAGIRCVIHIDDLIVANQDRGCLIQDRQTILWLLMKLGFTINWDKCILDPKQLLEFLGFLVDTIGMRLVLPDYKVRKIQEECQRLMTDKMTTVRQLAKLIGKMTAAIRAILPAPLNYRYLQCQKNQALLKGNLSYESTVRLTPACLAELQWWTESIDQWNGKAMISPSPDIAIQLVTDASKKGWGAHCGEVTTQGLWDEQEKRLHINVLEMKAVLFALKAFTKDKSSCQVHIKTDNVTTVAHINKMGGTRSQDLIQVTKEMWEYCMLKTITITAEHLPGHDNVVADWQSREYQDSSNWKLSVPVFQKIVQILGPVTVDMFADRMNAQMPVFYSWKPDPDAAVTDAFSMTWTQVLGYAFPPFCLIGRTLAKVRQDRATIVLVAPTWHAQPWYTHLITMLVAEPVLLPPMPNLLVAPDGKPHPLVQTNRLTLAAWKVSADRKAQKSFQNTLEHFSAKTDGTARTALTRSPGINGLAGVVNNRLIQFRPLWRM